MLCKTSNPGSNDLLTLPLASNETLFERIAHLSNTWSSSQSDTATAPLGLVVGATDVDALTKARAAAGQEAWILAPGVGAQGGNLAEAAQAGMNDQGTGMLIPVSRGISRAEDPALAAKELWEKINVVRKEIVATSEQKVDGIDAIAPYQRDFLKFSLDAEVLKFGSFVLKSGRTSPYFFNAGLFASGATLYKLGKSYAAAIMASPDL